MANAKITELPAGTVTGDCLLPLVCDPAGEPVTSKVTVDELLALVPGGGGCPFPVGTGFIDFDGTINPATQWPGTTWATVGDGRVLVGQDTGDADFNAIGETGGAKTVTLTEAQIPSHTHLQNAHNHTQDPHTHLQNAHAHVQSVNSATTGGLSGYTPDTSSNTSATSGYSTANTTAVNQNATATNQATTAVNQNTGGGEAHSIVQPYCVVKFWKRTA